MLGRSARNPVAPPPKRDIWSIGIYSGGSPFDLRAAVGADNPVLAAEQVTDVSAEYVADPFMIRRDGIWYMYFEVMTKPSKKGEIGLATSKDGLRWEYQRIVLSEPFHLSYPYVFEWEGECYMVPESYQANSIRLYKAGDFPDNWSFQQTLVEGDKFVDSCPFYFNKTWWLFAGAGTPPFRSDTLRLFYSWSLTGPWKEHPKSPIVTNNGHIARPGGRVLNWDDKLFRFTQDCDPTYGRLVRAYEVTELTERTYKEREVQAAPILEGGEGWAAMGMHHVDAHRRVDGTWLACVDGWYWQEG